MTTASKSAPKAYPFRTAVALFLLAINILVALIYFKVLDI